MRAKPARTLSIATALPFCVVPGCAKRQEPPPVSRPMQAAAESPKPAIPPPNGTVLVVRADRFLAADGVLNERTRVLRSIGIPDRGGTTPLVEVVVRRDDGRTAALMESQDGAPTAGKRICLDDATSSLQPSQSARR